jgi:hypothetical protein
VIHYTRIALAVVGTVSGVSLGALVAAGALSITVRATTAEPVAIDITSFFE